MENIKKIVLTGGPCGGKTTALDIINISQVDYGKYIEIEKRMVFTQTALEKEFYNLSKIFKVLRAG
ncbi:MAG: hypothetical protein UT37_C0017G0018 [Parcubacteria group bacterium GW2011_GWA2_39_18]|nr:MAG: hypothetical protein UT37_C0017G0018 [Parcubacteria group bacterium GW2011_GWA2_39_18]